MNDLTIIGTITFDRLHFRDHTRESFGGAPWFAIELNQNKKLKIGIATNIGKDFPTEKIPERIFEASKINIVNETTTTLDIFPDQKGIPAKVRNFTGEIKNIDSLKGKVVIISPLFQEIPIKSIKQCRKRFTIMIIEIQGFTRPRFKQNMKLSNDIKTAPKKLSQLCKIADVIKFSENELDAILPELLLEEKLNKLHTWGLKNIVITQSNKGCLISERNSKIKTIQTKAVSLTNTVGAGDKFVFLLGTFLAKNNSFKDSVIKAQRSLQILMEKVQI